MDLLAVLFITWLIKTFVSELPYAIRGQVPPRVQMKMTKAGTAASRPARYGLGDLVRDLWHDGLEDWRDERAHTRATKRATQDAQPGQPHGGTPPQPAVPAQPAGTAPPATPTDPSAPAG
ncbi:MAG TPA: hypothetical protein VJT31_35760, partial [Rugosimonospora sp.]|nr:hypothetical protein [Rugosimonospora sp.]